MTAGIAKQDPNTWKVKENAVYDKTQRKNLGGNFPPPPPPPPFFSALKKKL